MPKFAITILLIIMAFSFAAENLVPHKQVLQQIEIQDDAKEQKAEKKFEEDKNVAAFFQDFSSVEGVHPMTDPVYNSYTSSGFFRKPYMPPDL